MNKTIKSFIILVLFLLLSVGVVSATEVSNDTTITTDNLITQTETIIKENTLQNNINNDIETETTYNGNNPQQYTSLTDNTEYENALITLNSDTTYSDAQVTFKNNVTLQSNSNTLTNMKINVNGNNITINNVNFTHTVQSDAKVINITDSSNVTINNTNIYLYKTTGDYETKAITITDSTGVKIDSSGIEVSAKPQAITWASDDGWQTYYSVLNVAGIIVDDSSNVCITNNNINIYNNNVGLTGTTMPAVIVKNNARNSCIKNNNITVTGSHYNYGIMCSDYVSNITIRENNVNVVGQKNVVGIDASTSTGSIVYNNTVYANSTNTVGLANGEQSLAYGILTNTYYTGNANNYVAYNQINLTGTVVYAIENYMGQNNTFNKNNITATGTTVMGIGSWGSTYSKYINNNITLTGTGNTENTFYEQVNPDNTGICITGNTTYPSTNNNISGNIINLTAITSVTTYYSINISNATDNNISGNVLSVKQSPRGLPTTGNDTIPTITENTIEQNDYKVEFSYDDSEIIDCETLITVNKNLLKKSQTNTKKASATINLNADNFSDYVTNGLLNDNVNEGDVIDITTSLHGTQYFFEINKPVNVTSSNGKGYLNFETTVNNYDTNVFKIRKSGSGSNISNIKFHNTHLRTEEASNVTINNISFTHDRGIGYGVGAVSIRSSDNINITNSYFYGKDNAGHSIVVYATSTNCLFENNTIIAEGFVGDLLYITTYNTESTSHNITFRNNYIDNTKAVNQSICEAVVISGSGHLIENNTIKATRHAMMIQYYDSDYGEEGNPESYNVTVKDNTILQGQVGLNSYVTYINNIEEAKNIYITDENFYEYFINAYEENGYITAVPIYSKFESNTNVYINTSKFIDINNGNSGPLPSSFNYTSTGIRIMEVNGPRLAEPYWGAMYNTISFSQDIEVNGLWAPNYDLEGGNKELHVVNSTFSGRLYSPGISSTLSYSDCYIWDTKNNKVTAPTTTTITITSSSWGSKGSEPDGAVYDLVSNDNYENYFDSETFLLKEELENYNIAITENIDKTMIINKPVNIIGFTQLGSAVNKLYLIAGSDNSNITSLNINEILINSTKITLKDNDIKSSIILNNTKESILENNKITGDSQIILLNSVSNKITDNIINVTKEYTISIDTLSYDNEIINNNLTSSSHVGDESIENNGTNNINNPVKLGIYVLTNENVTIASLNNENHIKVNVTIDDEPVNEGYVVLICNGKEVDNVDIIKGEADLTLIPTETGYGTPLEFIYFADDKYVINKSSTIAVKDYINTNITIDYEGKVKDDCIITLVVKDENNQILTEGTLTYTLNNINTDIELTGEEIILKLDATEDIAGNIFTVKYTPTQIRFASSENSTILSLTKADTTIDINYEIIDDNNGNLTITLVDEFGNKLDNKRFSLDIDGNTTVQTITEGSITIPINSDKKELQVTATYQGNNAYTNSIITKIIKLIKDSTIITVTTNTPTVDEPLEITGTLTDTDNNPVQNTEVILTINNENTTVTTDDNGLFNYNLDPEKGTYNIIATFEGNENYTASTNKTKVYVKDPNNIDVEDLLNEIDELKQQNEKQNEILNQLLDLINKLQEQNNNQTQAIDELNDKIDNLTEQNNELKEQNENLTNKIEELTALEETTLTINSINNVKYGDSVVISGLLSSQKGNSLSNQEILISINGAEPVSVSTVNGVFEYKNTFRSVGEQTVTVTYEGNDYYKESETSITFNVEKQDTLITLDDIESVVYGDNVTITGTLTDINGRMLTSTNVVVTVNGKSVKAKTDSTGVFTASVKSGDVGEQTVTVTYAGNARYAESTTEATFTVDKQSVIITVDPINETGYGSNATITGTVTDANGKALVNTNVKVSVNGKTYTAKTDSTGAFEVSVLANAVGSTDVTVTYAGNARYDQVEASATFTVVEQDVELTVTSAELVDGTVTITGTFKDANGKALTNSNVVITINGKRYNVKTDSTGAFTYTGQTTESSVIFTLGYAGSARFNAITTDEQTLSN